MDWSSITHFLHMDGHGFYVWSAYGMAVFLVICESFFLSRRRSSAADKVRKEAQRMALRKNAQNQSGNPL